MQPPAPGTVGLFEAKTHFSAIVDRVRETGVPVRVTRRGQPMVDISPVRSEPTKMTREEMFAPVEEMRETAPPMTATISATPSMMGREATLPGRCQQHAWLVVEETRPGGAAVDPPADRCGGVLAVAAGGGPRVARRRAGDDSSEAPDYLRSLDAFASRWSGRGGRRGGGPRRRRPTSSAATTPFLDAACGSGSTARARPEPEAQRHEGVELLWARRPGTKK